MKHVRRIHLPHTRLGEEIWKDVQNALKKYDFVELPTGDVVRRNTFPLVGKKIVEKHKSLRDDEALFEPITAEEVVELKEMLEESENDAKVATID